MHVLAIYAINEHLEVLRAEARATRLAREANPRPSAVRRLITAVTSAATRPQSATGRTAAPALPGPAMGRTAASRPEPATGRTAAART